MSSSASSPSKSSVLTPSKLRVSSPKPSTPSKSQVTPLKSPNSKATKTKSPTPRKSSTPSKSLTPSKSSAKSSTSLKSQMSSPRQQSLMEMFTRYAVPAASGTSDEISSPTTATDDQPDVEHGQKLNTSSPPSAHCLENVEVLVEDSQMAPTSPAHVVDTQESMFVDETPPKTNSSDPTASAIADDDDDDGGGGGGIQLTPACDMVRDTCDSSSDNGELQRTVIHVEDIASVTLSPVDGITSQLPVASSVGKVSAQTADGESASHSQASTVSDDLVADSDVPSTAVSTDTITAVSHDATQHDVVNQTQSITLDDTVTDHTKADYVEYAQSDVDHAKDTVIDHTQASMLDLTQRTADHTQETVMDHTQPSVFDNTQCAMLGDMKHTVDHTQETVIDHTQPSVVDNTQPAVLDDMEAGENAIAADEENDVPLIGVTQSDDAIKLLGSADDVAFTGLKASKNDDDDAKRSASVTPSPHRCDKTLDGQHRTRRSKDAICTRPRHSRNTICTRLQSHVSRHGVETRQQHRIRQRKDAVHRTLLGRVSRRTVETRPQHRTHQRKNAVSATTTLQSHASPSVVETAPESCGKLEFDMNSGQEVTNTDKVDEPTTEMTSQEEGCSGSLTTPKSFGKLEFDMNSGQEVTNTDKVDEPTTEVTSQEEGCSGSLTSGTVAEDIACDMLTTNTDITVNAAASESTAGEAAVLVSVRNSSDADSEIDVNNESTVTADTVDHAQETVVDHNLHKMEVSETQTEVEKSTPVSEVGGECQWKIPTSSVAHSQSVTPADAPPETPTSIPRRCFTSRGSLMLERAKQLRQLATSPLSKSAMKSSVVDQNFEEDAVERSPSNVVGCGSSGLSRLKVFSPAASPSASILRKRQRSTDSAASSAQSPSSPSSRVRCQHHYPAV